MTNEEIKPTYAFAEVPEGTINPASPIKKTLSKTMVVTENFTIFDVMTYLAKMEKAIADKEAELDGLRKMKVAYEAELKLIEEALGVQKMEEEYQKTLAEEQASTEVEPTPNEEDVSGDTGSNS